MSAIEDLDDLLLHIGTGRWNYLFFFFSFMVPAVHVINLFGSDFMNPEPVFTCDIPDDNYTQPVNGSQCLMQEDIDGDSEIVPCKKWNYDTSVFHSTVSMKWDLVCDRAWIFPLFQTMYSAGNVVGAFLGAMIGSRYGRRMAIRIGGYLLTAATVMLIFVPWISGVLTARFLMGTFYTLMSSNSFILAMEVCKPSLRPVVAIVIVLPYALTMVGLAGIAYFIREWWLIQIIGSYPLLIILPLSLVIDESPRWLMVTGRLEEAVNVFERAVRLNQAELPDGVSLKELISKIHKRLTSKTPGKISNDSDLDVGTECEYCEGSSSVTQKEGSCICQEKCPLGLDDGVGTWWAGPVALFRTAVMRRIMLVLISMRLMQGMIYIGIPLNSGTFSSPFAYVGMLGLIEFPANCLALPLTKRFGRKKVAIPGLIVGGSLLLVYLIIKEAGINNEWVHMAIVLACYFSVCTAYGVNFLFAPELMPTTLRPLGNAACFFFASMGYGIAPFITDNPSISQSWISPAIFGTCGVIAGSLVFLLPETSGLPLPETVRDLTDRLNRERRLQKRHQNADDISILANPTMADYGSTEFPDYGNAKSPDYGNTDSLVQPVVTDQYQSEC